MASMSMHKVVQKLDWPLEAGTMGGMALLGFREDHLSENVS